MSARPQESVKRNSDTPNRLARLTDDEIVSEHLLQGANSFHLTEMLLRHKRESSVLGKRIARLNILLLLFTIAICLLTAVLVLPELGIVLRRESELAQGRTWVLWVWEPSGGSGVDEPVAAYTTQAECRAALATGQSQRGAFVTSLARCLPEVVDPRGPKTK